MHRAGANASSTITTSGAALADYSDEAEAKICDWARYDVVTNFGTLNSQGKKAIQSLAANLIAEKIVNYDPSGYTTLGESTTMLNVIRTNIAEEKEMVTEDKIKTYLVITT